MTNVEKKITPHDIDLNIKSMWEAIDNYLPVTYTGMVKEKLTAKNCKVSSESIRHAKSTRKGKPIIIRALYDVAIETKELLNP